MRPPDDKKYSLVSRKSSKRHISARDFRLPKPYRMPVSSDARRGMPRLRVALIAFSGLLIAGLIAALALITHENVTSPHPLAVADDKPAPRTAAPLRDAPPAAGNRSHAAPTAPARTAQPGARDDEPEPPTASAAAPPTLPPDAPADDPDVDLIATILLLTPARTGAAPACASVSGDSCSATAAPDP